jgi:hypothetical protein
MFFNFTSGGIEGKNNTHKTAEQNRREESEIETCIK